MFLSSSTSSSPCKLFVVLFILISHGASIVAQDDDDNRVVNIGAVIDVNSRFGKEEKIAMDIAVQEFNGSSINKYNIVLHVSDSGGDPLRACTAANDLIKELGAQTIVGMDTWQETVLVAEIADKAKVPVLSLAAPSITPPFTSVRRPFLLRMAYNDALQMECIASIVASYGWSRVIAIYEDDTYSTDSGVLTLLSDALGKVGSEIEHWMAFPPFSTLSDPDTVIREELVNTMVNNQSRVFIIVRSSVQLVTRLFPEAKHLGLMGHDSVWITTDTITSLFDTFNSSIMQSMKGVIGIKTHFAETSPVFKDFSIKFRNSFRSTYPEEDKSEPGIRALRAYDAVSTITKAIESSTYNGTSTTLLQNFLTTSFNGLSGEIRFNNGGLCSPLIYHIVNVVGKTYIDLKFWSSEFGFCDDEEMGSRGCCDGDKEALGGKMVYWPGGLSGRAPKGWVMPSNANPLKIGVPGRTSFEKFVKVKLGEDPGGFSIEVFKEAVKKLDYDLPHVYYPFNGKYDDLVDQVYLKNYSAVVGDVTILFNRSKFVEYTQPYAESGLSMVVPVKPEDRAWLFLKPFTKAMWLVTGSVFIYTMFVVWFLEHRSNQDFRGPWKTQLGTALWFTFSTLFFAHRERLNSNYSRVVIVVWLFIVFVVTSSYTASLTSMLTVQRLEPTVNNIEALRRSNSPVGCDGDSFVMKYLVEVLEFQPKNIINITSEYDYPDAFRNGTIKAAFLELPYEKVFLSRNCKDYKDAGLTYRFGGLGFVFPKGSPIARDISEAILKISEDGTITRLEKYWFPPESSQCSGNLETKSLRLQNFAVLFIVTAATSTIMLLLYILKLFREFRHHTASLPSDESLWKRFNRIASYLNKKTPIQVQPLNSLNENWISASKEYLNGYLNPGNHEESQVVKIEMAEAYNGHLRTPRKITPLASFPGRDRHAYAFDMENPEGQRPPSST